MQHPFPPFIAVAVTLAACWPSPSFAQDDGVVYAGASGGNGFNLYGGGVVALPGAALGQGLAVRAGASAGHYTYNSAHAASEIEGKYVSGEFALVYQTSGRWGWANFSAGPRVTYTALSPSDPSNKLSGTRWDAALQTDGALGDRWRMDWFASVGVRDATYNTEFRFGPLLDKPRQIRAGLETGVQGDPSYREEKIGAFVSAHVGNKFEARFSGGVTDQKNRSTDAYGAVSVSRVF